MDRQLCAALRAREIQIERCVLYYNLIFSHSLFFADVFFFYISKCVSGCQFLLRSVCVCIYPWVSLSASSYCVGMHTNPIWLIQCNLGSYGIQKIHHVAYQVYENFWKKQNTHTCNALTHTNSHRHTHMLKPCRVCEEVTECCASGHLLKWRKGPPG